MRRWHLPVHLLVALFFTAALLTVFRDQPAAAQSEPNFYWDFIDVHVEVMENGDMLVAEHQTYVFTGSWSNERYRYIPLENVESIEDIRVYQDDLLLESQSSVSDNERWLRWTHDTLPEWENLDWPQTRTFTIHYRARGALWRDGNSAHVDWRALFPDRAAEIRRGRVVVRLPRHLAGQVGEYGSFGAPANARQVDDRTVEFTTQRALAPGEELRVTVAFPGESFPADALRGGGSSLGKFLGIALAIVAGIALLGVLAFLALKMGRKAWRESGLQLAPGAIWVLGIGGAVIITGIAVLAVLLFLGVAGVPGFLMTVGGIAFVLLCLVFGGRGAPGGGGGGGSGGGGGGSGGGGGGSGGGGGG